MRGRKFWYVVGSALSFPFKKFSKFIGLYFYTLLIVCILVVISIHVFGAEKDEALGWLNTTAWPLVHLLGLFSQLAIGATQYHIQYVFIRLLIVLSFIPFLIGIIRVIVLDEVVSLYTLTKSINRIWNYIWALLKIFLIIVPIAVLGFFSTIILPAIGAGILGFRVNIIFIGLFGYLIIYSALFFLLIRVYFVPVLAALDRSVKIKDSLEITRGNGVLIAISMLTVLVITGIFKFIATQFFIRILPDSSLVSVIAYLGFMLRIAVSLLLDIPGVAALGYLYVVVTNKQS